MYSREAEAGVTVMQRSHDLTLDIHPGLLPAAPLRPQLQTSPRWCPFLVVYKSLGGLIFTNVNICGHSSSPLGAWTPEEVTPLSHLASSGLYPNPSVQDTSQPMRPGCQALFLKDRCYPHHRCQ